MCCETWLLELRLRVSSPLWMLQPPHFILTTSPAMHADVRSLSRPRGRVRDDTDKKLKLFGFGFEAVPHAADREQMLRTLGIVFNVAAQAHDEIIDGSGIGVFAKVPNLFKN